MTARYRSEIIILLLGLLCGLAEIAGRYRPAPLERASWLLGDCVSYRDVTRSILERGSLDYRVINPLEMERYRPGNGKSFGAAGSNVALTVDNVPVPQRSILMPLAMVLPYAVGQEYGLLGANVVQCIVLVLLVYWLARRYFSELAALVAACGFLAASIVRNFMYNMSPDVFGSVLVLGGVVLVRKEGARRWQLLAGGVLMGLSLWLRPLNLIAMAALLPAAVITVRERRLSPALLWPVVGIALGVSGDLILNTVWFGSPLVTGYDRTMVMNAGEPGLASLRDNMNRVLADAWVPTLFTSPKGFIQTAPYWPLFLPTLFWLARRKPLEAGILALLVFAPVAFLLKYDFWDTSHFGNRFMFVPAAVSAMAIAWVMDRLSAGTVAAAEPPPVDPSSKQRRRKR